MSKSVQEIRKRLRHSIDSTPKNVSQFFKTGVGDYAEHDQFMGVTVPTLRKMAKSFASLSLDDLTVLLQSPFNEERLLALIILSNQYANAREEQKEAFYQFYQFHIKQINNWNLVDSSAHLIMGAYLFEKDRSVLLELAASPNLWERRIAIVATWYFIRKGDTTSTFEIAQRLLHDKQDLIHKAVGWMLREAGKKEEARLLAFLSEQAHRMPKTMLRYAMERLSLTQKIATQSAIDLRLSLI
ncbi:MAG: DNA alkylation repair protein [Vampirovibrionales bacterium]